MYSSLEVCKMLAKTARYIEKGIIIIGISIFAILVYFWTFYLLNFVQRISICAAIAIWLLLVIPASYSTVIECSFCLSLPGISATKMGRNILLLMALGVLLAGPVQNMLENARRLAGAVECVSKNAGSEEVKLCF